MSQFISSLAVSINASGISPRASTIFNQAMIAGKFRWGRKAKLVAGASLAIALREYRRPDSLDDISYLLDEPCPTLVRTLTNVVSLLDISLTPVDPTIHIPPLLDHLSSLINNDPLQPQSEPKVALPAPLLSQLKIISLRAAANTATSLYTLLTRLGPDHPLNLLPSPPTAVSLFLLGLEAESRSPLSQLGELAGILGSRCHKTSRGVAMGRYKIVQDEIASWIEQVPWLKQYEQRNTGKGKNRAKLGKRSIVARGIADVLQFQEEIWRGGLKPTVALEVTEQELEEDDKDEDLLPARFSESFVPNGGPTLANALSCSLAVNHKPLGSRPPPPKRRKIAHHALRDASQFLLSPLSGPLPPCESPPKHLDLASPQAFQANAATAPLARQNLLPQHVRLRIPAPHCTNSGSPIGPMPVVQSEYHPQTLLPQPQYLAKNASTYPQSFLTSYILTAPTVSALCSSVPPTRLQILAASRATADDVDDSELFGEGELEVLLRNPAEAKDMQSQLLGLGILVESDEDDKDINVNSAQGNGRGKGKARMKRNQVDDVQRKSRVDLAALARFLGNGGDDEDKGDAYDAVLLGLERLSDKDEDESLPRGEHEDYGCMEDNSESATAELRTPPRTKTPAEVHLRGADDGEILLTDWRPLSPETNFGFARGGGTVYEEEYD
ncbi:hypothetical protein H0H81_011665 [Sphagnurus paluster]|uniref:Uncharacterized protein n=1 Tax=Sphagnurus paluster TaxID=117069 RepID=A0A9P7GHC7_9AGAR|nr:hypothetical protein H0H81_011665 [Sphagnurus paluster]